MNSQLQMYAIKAPWSDGYMDYISSHQDLLEVVMTLAAIEHPNIEDIYFLPSEKRRSYIEIEVWYFEGDEGNNENYSEVWSAYPLQTLDDLKEVSK